MKYQSKQESKVLPPKTPGSATTDPNKLPVDQALKMLLDDRDRYWNNARREIHRSARELIAQQEDERERGIAYNKLIHGSTQKKEIALTFDDGPHPLYTTRLLTILTQYRVPATFFCGRRDGRKIPRSRTGATTCGSRDREPYLPPCQPP